MGEAFARMQEEMNEALSAAKTRAAVDEATRNCSLMWLFRELRKEGVSPDVAAKAATRFIVTVLEA